MTVALAGCTGSSGHKPSFTPAPTLNSLTPSSSGVLAPLLPSGSSSTAVWSVAYAATQFTNLLTQFSTDSAGTAITDSSTFADYIQYSQRIANACAPFLAGLRAGQWPAKAELTIVQFTRLQQTVCDVELARGQAGSIQLYKGVQPPPANADTDLLNLRLKIYSLLGI
jgi:hypothetical protein